jgi:O-antigen/teichoic acid export membrane protein
LRLLAATVISAASSFLLTMLVGRARGPAGLGVYAGAMAALMVALTLVELGFSILLTREAARRPRRMNRLLLGSSLLKLMLLLATTPWILRWSGVVSTELWLPGLLWVLLSALALSPQALLRGRGRFSSHLFLQLLEAGALLPAAALVARVRPPVAVFLWLLACAQGLKLLAALAAHLRELAGEGGRWSIAGPFLPWLIRSAARFAATVLISVLYFRADVLGLRILAGAAVTGRYAAALAFFESAKLLPSALLGVLYPRFAAAGTELAAVASRGLGRALALAALAAAAVGLLGGWIVPATFGQQFAGGGGLLPALAPILLPATLTSGLSLLLFARARELVVAKSTALALALLATVMTWLVPAHGAAGAVAARAAGETVLCLLLLAQSRRVLAR